MQDAYLGFEVISVPGETAFDCQSAGIVFGDILVTRTRFSPWHHRRSAPLIEATETNQFLFEYNISGWSEATQAGPTFRQEEGEAVIYDYTQPCEYISHDYVESFLVNIPRYMMQDLFPEGVPTGKVRPSPALTLATAHLHHLVANAETLPDDAGALLGRSICSLIAAAMVPLLNDPMAHGTPSTLQRMRDWLDRNLNAPASCEAMAHALGVDVSVIAKAADRAGGLDGVGEQQRLLAVYRRLSNPFETAPISELAQRYGYSDAAQFSRSFRNTFAASPTGARAQRGNGFIDIIGTRPKHKNLAPFMIDL